MIKKLILISTVLIVTSGCSEAYEKYVEGQDVYLSCYQEADSDLGFPADSDGKYPEWYSFNTDKEGESTGYFWDHDDPMKRIELTDVVIYPLDIEADNGFNTIELDRETLRMTQYRYYQCYEIGYLNAKTSREKYFKEMTKNNKI